LQRGKKCQCVCARYGNLAAPAKKGKETIPARKSQRSETTTAGIPQLRVCGRQRVPPAPAPPPLTLATAPPSHRVCRNSLSRAVQELNYILAIRWLLEDQFGYSMGKRQWTQHSKNSNPSITAWPDDGRRKVTAGFAATGQPNGVGTRARPAAPRSPTAGGSGRTAPPALLGAPAGAGCAQGCRHRLSPRCSRQLARSGTGPLDYFRSVIAGYGFRRPPPLGSDVV